MTPLLYILQKRHNSVKASKLNLGTFLMVHFLLLILKKTVFRALLIRWDVSSYDEFLCERRKLMAALIEKYYKGL